MSIYEEFNKQYGVKHQEMTHEQAVKTADLIADELEEFLAEFYPNATLSIDLGVEKVPNPNLHNAAKELTDIRYITGQQMEQSGFNVDNCDTETHRSNMSKSIPLTCEKQAFEELSIARKRYQNAELVRKHDCYIIQDSVTHKVIKPTTYSPAFITDEMIGK